MLVCSENIELKLEDFDLYHITADILEQIGYVVMEDSSHFGAQDIQHIKHFNSVSN